MSHYLLLGAGFSRNWGGWLAAEAFEYLLGCPEVARNPQLQALLWRNQPNGGFENALAEVQANFIRSPQEHTANLQDMQSAVARMFDDMNRGFLEHTDFEFQQARERMVGTFLTRFDAIFTLNQDLLLEHYYIDRDVSLQSNGRWGGSEMPGMRPIPNPNAANPNSWAQREWMPAPIGEFNLDARMQPYFKLHGSSNWRETHGAPMLVMGGNKMREIGASPILARYHQVFEESLSRADARLMVIGYGFRDSHINDVIMRAINDRGMRMFVIAPEGGDLARVANPTHAAPIRVGTNLEATFERGLMGASRRPLRDIFGGDTIEFNKVMRFFEA
nr:SIR2 family protein [uncultured Ralstonia sp.]